MKWTQEEVSVPPYRIPEVTWEAAAALPHREQHEVVSRLDLFIRLFSLQDEKLKALVQKLGTTDWKYIASYIPVGLFSLSLPLVPTSFTMLIFVDYFM